MQMAANRTQFLHATSGGLITSVRMAANRTQFLHATSGGWSPQCEWLQTEHSSHMQPQGADHLNANGWKQNTVLSHLHFVVSCVITCKLWGLITSMWMDAKRTQFKVNYTLYCILFYSMQALGADHHLDRRDWKQNTVLSHLHFLSCIIIYRLWGLITTSMRVAEGRTQFSVAYTSLYPVLLCDILWYCCHFPLFVVSTETPWASFKTLWLFKMRHNKLQPLT